ncbi:hypothetical protein [Thiomicrorhabdus sp.]|uniref:hypothetical protein n=1 Tax=Thiomicrorhabdus sp. TaxID=2039724 RepID=UPI002AA86520|nr:hypothetical protein [Thiomicrorhabdus sp.]
MLKTHFITLSISCLTLASFSTNSSAAEQTRAILMTQIQGQPTQSNPYPVELKIVQGPAKGCKVYGTAHLNAKRLRYEYKLQPVNCIKNGHAVSVGTVVRGQHNIKGTMANSGLGRDYLVSNKGVTVTLSNE